MEILLLSIVFIVSVAGAIFVLKVFIHRMVWPLLFVSWCLFKWVLQLIVEGTDDLLH